MSITGVIAILFFILGVLLLAGNVRGCMTSFPLAGFIFLAIGSEGSNRNSQHL